MYAVLIYKNSSIYLSSRNKRGKKPKKEIIFTSNIVKSHNTRDTNKDQINHGI